MDYLEKSFASASETSKLLITLSTGVIAFCAAVVNVKDADRTIFTPTSPWHKWSLAICWLLLLITIGNGVWTQLAITHVLSEGTAQKPTNPWQKRITFPYILQLVSFALGILVLVVYGMARLFSW